MQNCKELKKLEERVSCLLHETIKVWVELANGAVSEENNRRPKTMMVQLFSITLCSFKRVSNLMHQLLTCLKLVLRKIPKVPVLILTLITLKMQRNLGRRMDRYSVEQSRKRRILKNTFLIRSFKEVVDKSNRIQGRLSLVSLEASRESTLLL